MDSAEDNLTAEERSMIKRPKIDPEYNASEDRSLDKYDDRFPDDTQEGRVTAWITLDLDSMPEEEDLPGADAEVQGES